MATPMTDGEHRYDHLRPLTAALAAWVLPEARDGWHESAKDRVRAAMPLLGRALDRAVGIEDPDALVAMLSEADQAAGMPYGDVEEGDK